MCPTKTETIFPVLENQDAAKERWDKRTVYPISQGKCQINAALQSRKAVYAHF